MSNDDYPSAIMGVTKTCRTHVDGSIVFQIEIEPRHAQAAFMLFGAPGTPVAMARMALGVAQQQAQRETAESHLKGGALAKLAGQICEAEPFRQWLRLRFEPLPQTAEDAATIIRNLTGVSSRAMLDHDDAAAAIFHREFRLPYNAWLTGGMK